MNKKFDFKVGDKVAHKFRDNYQKCEIIGIQEGINGLIEVFCEDSTKYGFIGGKFVITGTEKDICFFPPQDFKKVDY